MNWFRKDADGKFLWPGVWTEHSAVLKWIVDRVHGRAQGKESPIGWVPYFDDIHWEGLNFSRERFEELQRIDPLTVEKRKSCTTRGFSSISTTICRRR